MKSLWPFVGVALLWVTVTAHAGEAPTVASPEVHADRKVTFRLLAPKAESVALFGDWMKPGTTEAMTKDEKGTWSATVGPLAPTVSIYHFVVDGMTIADPVNPRMKLRARTSASLVEVPAEPPALWQAQDVPHGTIHIHPHLAASLNNEQREFRVYTPPGYEAKENAERRYPVLYLLHGSNDTAAGWTDVGRAHFILDNLIAQTKAEPMIVVMPFGHALPFGSKAGDNTAAFERHLLKDVMPLVEKHYRGAPGREKRAIVRR
jgi:enterochelin esterase-like enzyme